MDIGLWAEAFKDFRQVEDVAIDRSGSRLAVRIAGQGKTLKITLRKLDESLSRFRGNPHEVITDFLKRKGILVYYQNTLVGFFDIQAYSAFIKSNSLERAAARMERHFTALKSGAETDAFAVKFDHWRLSDSIILVIDTNRHPLFTGSLEYFLATCSMLLRESMEEGFPLRGAIGGGDFYKDGEILVSSALIDAVPYEKEQEWFGAVLTPKALEIIENAKAVEIKYSGKTNIDLSSDRFKSFVRYGTVPWKQGSQFAEMDDHREMFFIKPYTLGSDRDWAAKYVLSQPHFRNQERKIDNSHRLYAEE
jgi:hypothetical protein